MKAYEFEPGEQVVIYADGSSRDNGKPNARGGWGFVILDKTETWKRFENWGAEHGANNNQMELRAAIEALVCICARHASAVAPSPLSPIWLSASVMACGLGGLIGALIVPSHSRTNPRTRRK